MAGSIRVLLGYLSAMGYLDVNSGFNHNVVSKGVTLSTGEWETGYDLYGQEIWVTRLV